MSDHRVAGEKAPREEEVVDAPPTPTPSGVPVIDSPQKEAPAALVTSTSVCPFPLGPEVQPPRTFHFFTERYFTQFVVRNCRGVEGCNVRLLLHSNMLVILCMDPSHDLCRRREEEGMGITFISHSARKNKATPNRRESGTLQVQGKKKKNAMVCQKEMTLCYVETQNGSTYKIPACIDGLVLELNQHILETPTLLTRFPLQEGFIAIINPQAKVAFTDFEKVWTCTSGDLNVDNE